MKERKDIDRLFQETLKDFEELPSPKMWNAIESKIQTSKKKRTFPLWSKTFRVAAIAAILLTVATAYMLPQYDYFSFFTEKNDTFIAQKERNNDSVTANHTSLKEKTTHLKEEEIVSKNLNNAHNTEKTNADFEEKQTEVGILQNEINHLKKLSENSNIKKKKAEKENSSFTISTVFAPIYSNSFVSEGNETLLNKQNVSPNLSYAYGVKFAYQFSKKLSLQSGVNIVNIGYSANNIYVSPNVVAVDFSHLSNSRFSNIPTIMASTERTVESAQFNEKGILNQVFGYVEIPLELKYNLINGKVGMNLVGGFSTFLLNKNEAFIQTNSFSQSLGEMKDIRPVNFSGNIGVDVNYLINDNLYINVSPMFKMQTGTFIKNSHGFYPYYLGVYTGLNYKF